MAFLTAKDFDRLPEQGFVDPGRVRFSQHSIAPVFRDARFGTVTDLARELRRGEVRPEDVLPIRLVVSDDMVFSLDNRRLKAFRDAGVNVPYTKMSRIPSSQRFKFTTQNQGMTIHLRS